MTVDSTDPGTFDDDTAGTGEPGTDEALADVPAEAPEADTAEQHADLAPHRDTPQAGDPDSASEADRAEQARVVELDEDEYR
jgi:hypothetical protein